jgi:O-succinylbenzoic acid--CoA ligase
MTETISHIAFKKLNNFSKGTSDTLEKSYYTVLSNVKIYKDTRNCLVIHAPKVSEEIIFTNDVVELISDTQFSWVGRFDNVINSGGIKLHPEIIEEKLSEIISNRFFVAGIPDNQLGEKLILILEGNPQQLHFNEAHLSKYEIPKETYFVDAFIETETKKIQRKKTLDLIDFIK